jgi:hypothetical protein
MSFTAASLQDSRASKKCKTGHNDADQQDEPLTKDEKDKEEEPPKKEDTDKKDETDKPEDPDKMDETGTHEEQDNKASDDDQASRADAVAEKQM